MAIHFINTTNGPVDVTTLPAPAPKVPSVTVIGGCGDCGAELSALLGEDDEVQALFCDC
jgi:hypothetical protein